MAELGCEFTAALETGEHTGAWTCVFWPESVAFFGTRGLVKVRGTSITRKPRRSGAFVR